MATPKKPTTANQREDRVTAKPTAPTQTINLYGSPASIAAAKPAPVVTPKSSTKSTGKAIPNAFVPAVPSNQFVGPIPIGTTRTATGYVPGKTETAPKTLVSRIAKYDSKGKVIGYDLIYSDGSTGFEPNPSYGQEEETVVGTTDVQVIKAMLLGRGFPSSLVDSSVTFLTDLLKDGIDADSAIDIYLNTKSYTTKKGTVLNSPFYSSYGFYNDALADNAKYSASELFNTVEGYKGVRDKYGISDKFVSQDYIQKYLKNKRSVADLDMLANTARLKAISSDPAIVDTLKKLNFINGAQDLTDFYMDPNVGTEKMQQNINTAAFAIEAVRRANPAVGVAFDKTTAEQYGAALTAQGLSEAQVTALASKGYENIAGTLEPMTKYSGIFERAEGATKQSIQTELEAEQFKGLESERRKRLAELAARSFQGSAGTTSQSLSTGSTLGAI
jgi:hypothetical protein